MLVMSKCTHQEARSLIKQQEMADKLASATAKIKRVKGKWITKSRGDTREDSW